MFLPRTYWRRAVPHEQESEEMALSMRPSLSGPGGGGAALRSFPGGLRWILKRKETRHCIWRNGN